MPADTHESAQDFSKSRCTGPLRIRLAASTREALARGTLRPLTTRVEQVRDGGLDFVVRTLVRRAEKPHTSAGDAPDPFLPPWEPGLHVADLDEDHVLLLNKYNVLENHALVVTRRFADQTELLDEANFAAWLEVLAGTDALGFYNGGGGAGASQPHKHMQAVPLTQREPVFSFRPLFDNAAAGEAPGRIVQLAGLPFAHAAARLDPEWRNAPRQAAGSIASLYRELWKLLDLEPADGFQPMPYNLLLAGEWMWLVPRRRETFDGISVNGLGFAGALLVPDDAAREKLLRTGPSAVLDAVADIR
ncbi:MAG: hypothetical protein RQ847_04670 [Wenzhouxiangellaceae bacterium]|nr:hypothetical protein [Wenzhouxiangellaceae bacterium]